MATWEDQPSSTPLVKFEDSPAESFVSTPGELYPSLFDPAHINSDDSAMTPQSVSGEEKSLDALAASVANTPAPEDGEKKSGDGKQTKKRKSWGQVLPEPKTNLPPRKRAKTEDEKEQRRVERVLRNRRAAQSSRERKRQEVEALELRNQALEAALREQQKTNLALIEELRKFQRSSGVVHRSSSPSFQPSPLTLARPLFGSSSETDLPAQAKMGLADDFVMMSESTTVNPASISPELNPVPDSDVPSTTSSAKEASAVISTPATTTTDATQYPAVSVGGGATVVAGLTADGASGAVTLPAVSNAADHLLGSALGLPASLDADSWSYEAQFSPSSDPLNFEYNHLDGDSSAFLPDFDLNDFLSDDVVSGAAPSATAGIGSVSVPQDIPGESVSLSLLNSETQVSS